MVTREIKIIKICDALINAIILLIIGLSPIFFQCGSFRCWEVNQLALLQTLVEVLVFIWLVKVLLVNTKLNIGYRYLWPVFLFFLALVIVTLNSGFFELSFLGAYSRKMGLITWIHLFIFFTIFIFEIKSKKQIDIILIIIFIASTIVCLYGFLQILGVDFMNWGYNTPFLSRRIFSSLGQPNFLASWLLMVLPLCFFSIFHWSSLKTKILIAILFVALLASLMLTLSRGAWIGFMGQIIFVIFLFLFLYQKKKIILFFSLALIAIGLIYICLNVFVAPPQIGDSAILSRLESLIFLKQSTTGYTRLIGWNIALDLIKKRPILGYGPETLELYANQYYQPVHAVFEAINSFPDRAHNDILDTLFNGGAILLITYLIMLGTLFYLGLRAMRQLDKYESYFLIALMTGIFGYLVSIQFSFHVIPTIVYLFLFFGLIFVIVKRANHQEGSISINKLTWQKTVLLVILLGIILLFIWQFNIKMLIADLYYKQAYLSLRQQKISQGMDYYQKIFAIYPEESFYRSMFARDILNLVENNQFLSQKEKIKMIDSGLGALNDVPSFKRDLWDRATQAKFFALRAKLTQDKKDFLVAEQVIENLINYSPHVALLYYDWCQLKFDEGQLDEAAQKCQQAISLYPDLKHPYLNEIHRQQIIDEMIMVYQKLGQIYFLEKDYQRSLENYWQVLHLSPFQYHIYKKIADIYYVQKDLNTALKYNLKGYSLSPKDYNWPFAIALLYYEKGDYKNVKNFALQAQKLNPDDLSLKEFLKKLK